MSQQTLQRRSLPRRRGFTLIEVMIAMAILAVAILGALQMQVLASKQTGLAQRTTRASALLRDFQETAQAFPWDHPRLRPIGQAGNCVALADLDLLSEDVVGNGEIPAVPLDYTANTDGNAGSVAEVTAALEPAPDAEAYRGLAREAFSVDGQQLGQRGYQLAWRVSPIDTNADGTCEARLVEAVVRFQVGQSGNWRSYVGQFMQYDPTLLLSGANFDLSRMEAW